MIWVQIFSFNTGHRMTRLINCLHGTICYRFSLLLSITDFFEVPLKFTSALLLFSCSSYYFITKIPSGRPRGRQHPLCWVLFSLAYSLPHWTNLVEILTWQSWGSNKTNFGSRQVVAECLNVFDPIFSWFSIITDWLCYRWDFLFDLIKFVNKFECLHIARKVDPNFILNCFKTIYT